MSARTLGQLIKDYGGKWSSRSRLSSKTWKALINDERTRSVQAETLKTLAGELERPLAEVWIAAGQTLGFETEVRFTHRIPAAIDTLTERQQRDVLSLIETAVSAFVWDNDDLAAARADRVALGPSSELPG